MRGFGNFDALMVPSLRSLRCSDGAIGSKALARLARYGVFADDYMAYWLICVPAAPIPPAGLSANAAHGATPAPFQSPLGDSE